MRALPEVAVDSKPFSTLPSARSDWAYFLDVDGTLIDLAEWPDAIRVDEELLDLVACLHQSCGGAVALVSGRALADLDRRLAGIRVPAAGQHGLERRDGTGVAHAHGAAPAEMLSLRQGLARLVTAHPGLLLEDKGLTLAVHYRQAPNLAGYVHRFVRRLVKPLDDRWVVQKGKRVVEIKPGGFDKGSVIAEFMAEAPFKGRRPVFIGDDLTDECGFEVINRYGGVSVKVGAGATRAAWRLPDAAAVRLWLSAAAGIGGGV